MHEPKIAAPVMNIIGGHHQLSQDRGVLSVVINPKTQHGFIVFEHLNANGNRVNKEAHLGHRLTGNDFDMTKCGIHLDKNAPDAKLQHIHKSFYYRSWPVSKEDYKKYIKTKITEDQKKCNSDNGVSYNKYVTLEQSWPGKVGDVFDLFKLEHLKQDALDSLNASVASNASIAVSKESVIASLDNGVEKSNCLQWALSAACAIPYIKLSMQQGFWNNYVIVMPKNAIPNADQSAADLDGPGGTQGCRII